MLVRKGFVLRLMEIGLTFATAASAQLFATWLSDKWKKNGEKQINVKIENHLYQFDPALLAEAIEKAMAKLEQKKPPSSALRSPSENRSASRRFGKVGKNLDPDLQPRVLFAVQIEF